MCAPGTNERREAAATDSLRDTKAMSERLCAFVREQIVAEGTSFDENTALSALGFDSLATVELLLFIERCLGMAVPEAQITRANLHSIAALARCVSQLAVAEPHTPGTRR